MVSQIPSSDGRCVRWALVGMAALVAGAALGTAVTPPGHSAEDAPESIKVDEDLTLRFPRPVRKRDVDAATIEIRSGGNAARGVRVIGRPLFDKATRRRVVVRPEAVREYYELALGLDRSTATRKTERLLRKVERRGKAALLASVDRGLVTFFGPSYGAGARLDDEAVTAVYPPNLVVDDPLGPYRRVVAGDDQLWEAYLGGDLEAFARLETDETFERFYHPVDPESGAPDAESLLRQREHRRVLVHSNKRYVTFFPDLPIRDDASDLPALLGEEYRLRVRNPLKRAKTVTFATSGGPVRLPRSGISFGISADEPLFSGPDEQIGDDGVMRPRIVNVTPPNGERLVDATTDWEDPDNMFAIPPPARKTFTIRARFAAPLDPRTVNPTTFRLTKTRVAPGTPDEVHVQDPVEVGVFLAQTRLGEVRVDVTPALNLDPDSEYELRVSGRVRGLGGRFLDVDYRTTFLTR